MSREIEASYNPWHQQNQEEIEQSNSGFSEFLQRNSNSQRLELWAFISTEKESRVTAAGIYINTLDQYLPVGWSLKDPEMWLTGTNWEQCLISWWAWEDATPGWQESPAVTKTNAVSCAEDGKIHQYRLGGKQLLSSYTESQKVWGWKGPASTRGSNTPPWARTLPPDQAVQSLIQSDLEHCREWGVKTFLSNIFQCPTTLRGKKFCPNI